MKIFVSCALVTVLAGCAGTNSPKNSVDYNVEDIRRGGIYELRGYMSQESCPAESVETTEAAAIVLALAAPLVEKSIDFVVEAAMNKIAAYGDELTKPYPLNVNFYPFHGGATVGDVKCVIVAYGEFGDGFVNNLSGHELTKPFAQFTPLRDQLSGNLGFAMQISVQSAEDKVSLVPAYIYYPKSLHPGSSVKQHSLSLDFSIGGVKVNMGYGEISSGFAYGEVALGSQKKTIDKAQIKGDEFSLQVTEGPDNETLGKYLIKISDKETTDALKKALQDAAKKKLDDKGGSQ
ncbi:hypothetical protein [Pseudomonas citronellolis]|uniref:hypothetical protein n=1 Tax=Pseudomonas citronellolis TaxID=53408 RepID=UPI0022BA5372|nr:hypothetical protein [Pseudomonas citronellolis]WBG63187.1 hypothetical protein ELR50_10020 [Pseudomonas citronellolis]